MVLLVRKRRLLGAKQRLLVRKSRLLETKQKLLVRKWRLLAVKERLLVRKLRPPEAAGQETEAAGLVQAVQAAEQEPGTPVQEPEDVGSAGGEPKAAGGPAGGQEEAAGLAHAVEAAEQEPGTPGQAPHGNPHM